MTMTNQLYSDTNHKSIRKQRHIIRRIIVRGTLVLDTPTCLGTGNADSPTDLPLLRDSISDRALLTGSSIAGALRNYLHEHEHGYGYLTDEKPDDFATALFGGNRRDDDGEQSPLIIDDAISTKPIQAELRDGVKINSITRTAADKAKYDLELLQAGTEFTLSFELLIEKNNDEPKLIKALILALEGLEPQDSSQSGEISLGMKKRRGFGRCHVKEWQVWYFNLEDTSDRILWLNFEHWRTGLFSELPSYSSIKEAFTQANIKVNFDELNKEDKRDRFTINATFTLASPLLIRSGQSTPGRAPDVVHLKSKRHGEDNPVPILSGTSLAGVLRHRAERIIKTIQCSSGQNLECDKEPEIVQSIFGQVENKKSQASRLVCKETEIKKYKELVQTRIAIDRFTGGAYHGALFQEQPVFGDDKTCITLELELRQPKDYEIGLLLLLIKDLWTSDLPVGGESSIGRGRLKGIKADLIRHHSKEPKGWTIAEANGSLQVMNLAEPKQSEDLVKDELEQFVKALQKELDQEVSA